MKRKPKGPKERMFNRDSATVSFVQGFVVLVIVTLVFVNALNRGLGEDGDRTMAFATIVFSNLALILTNWSWSQTIIGAFRNRNTALLWVFGGALLALVLVLYVPGLSNLFLFSTLLPIDLLICFATGFASIMWFEIYKAVRKKF